LRIFRTVSFRVFAGSLLILLTAFALYATYTVRFVAGQMMGQALETAQRVSDTIERSTRYSMLLNRKEDVYQIIRTIGTETGVDGIRIYNKRGEITFSTSPSERGTLVDLHAEACYACHAPAQPLRALSGPRRTRIFDGPNGHRVLGVINPIRNSEQCMSSGCHAGPEERTVLGVLDVRMSLEHVDAAIAEARSRTVRGSAIGFALVAIVSSTFLYLVVRRPIRTLFEGTRQIAAGNLEHEIPVRSDDDLGRLALSFNAMTRSLRESQQENERWSRTLEERVREKSAELERAHRQVLQAEKMASLGTLAATVAHEINNPLSGILSYARLISKRLRRDETAGAANAETLKDLDVIVQETQRCGGIVNNLLLFARRSPGAFHAVAARDVIERARRLVAHHMEIANVRFESVCEPPDVAIHGDDGPLEQALVALFVNAVEACAGGGTLSVAARAERPSGDVVLLVSDTGVGISPADLPHIFEPFYSTKRAAQGVGLGLSVVFGIVERHGGTIGVASEPGRGTTFTLRFPGRSAATLAGG
jgi:two-component system NtrC family sensor kinase